MWVPPADPVLTLPGVQETRVLPQAVAHSGQALCMDSCYHGECLMEKR